MGWLTKKGVGAGLGLFLFTGLYAPSWTSDERRAHEIIQESLRLQREEKWLELLGLAGEGMDLKVWGTNLACASLKISALLHLNEPEVAYRFVAKAANDDTSMIMAYYLLNALYAPEVDLPREKRMREVETLLVGRLEALLPMQEMGNLPSPEDRLYAGDLKAAVCELLSRYYASEGDAKMSMRYVNLIFHYLSSPSCARAATGSTLF